MLLLGLGGATFWTGNPLEESRTTLATFLGPLTSGAPDA
jgi:hypothetical protein